MPHFFRQGCQAATGCESSMSQPEPPHADPLGPFPVVKGQQPLGHTNQKSLVRTTRISTAWPRTRTPPVNLCAAFGARPSAVAAPSLREFPEYINRVAPIVR